MNLEDGGFRKLIPFVPTEKNIARAVYELLDLKPGKVVYDLGCGKGDLLLPVDEFHLRGVGFEIEESLAAEAAYRMRKRKLPVVIIPDDFGRAKYWRHLSDGQSNDVKIADADGIVLYLISYAVKMIEPRLRKELRKRTRIVSLDFAFSDNWPPIGKVPLASGERHVYDGISGYDHTAYIYEVID